MGCGVKHDGKSERHAVRDSQRVWIIERDPSFRHAKRRQGNEDVTDIAHGLPYTSFVNHQNLCHNPGYENRSHQQIHQQPPTSEGAQSPGKFPVPRTQAA